MNNQIFKCYCFSPVHLLDLFDALFAKKLCVIHRHKKNGIWINGKEFFQCGDIHVVIVIMGYNHEVDGGQIFDSQTELHQSARANGGNRTGSF